MSGKCEGMAVRDVCVWGVRTTFFSLLTLCSAYGHRFTVWVNLQKAANY
jgi:hypothetical protein